MISKEKIFKWMSDNEDESGNVRVADLFVFISGQPGKDSEKILEAARKKVFQWDDGFGGLTEKAVTLADLEIILIGSPHEISPHRCLVIHSDGGQCGRCSICNKWIRPEDWDKPCLSQEECICNLDPDDTCPVKIFNEDCPIHGFSEDKTEDK